MATRAIRLALVQPSLPSSSAFLNLYKFGLSGATDSHTGLATTREENYFGKYQSTEPSPDRHNNEVIPADDPSLRILTSQEVASGLTAVWARENTRAAIFDAMKRREVFATTGTRIRVRVFAGWDFEADEVSRPISSPRAIGVGCRWVVT